MIKFLLAASLVLLLSACMWVKPTPRSHSVLLVGESDIANCVKKGITSSKTLSKIVFIPRNEEKVYGELVVLAKNEAVIMGGDVIVPKGKISGGSLDFIVYQCR